ncbi:SDR family NAD(P)-dependent oxidoreductase [Sphingomonas sp. G124]|uniref:SDR family NAD(P)-dependent oxidoreductase n=1 Tax=Sphingomonas cremea TaxID=2904799 RepID=A0A9X1QJT5_9SPHN|nr:SDR family NAD(P)-dependent oxidoreductase [Sphingomonas cremea]MCF2515038.1 SDR family NAD(P)-dependent oxidoreductase [Sphingomonas cremea]
MNKTVFITGVTAGIGAATARKFVSEGWQVVGTGRRRDRLDELATELGDFFYPMMLDMRCPDDFGPARDALPERYRGIDLLLNNAGLAPPMSNLQDAGQEPLDVVIDTNVTGLVALTRTLLPRLIERKGAIINLSSVAATYPYRGGAVYAGSKAFVRQFGLGLRCDLAGTGVRVTSIEPGMVETEFTLVRTGGDQSASDALYANMDPMTAQDIAETIWWVATLPPHLNINAIELMPTTQSWAGFAVHRHEG